MGSKFRILDVGPVPVYYCSEIISAEVIDGCNVRIRFAERRIIERELLLVPTVDLIRPTKSCLQLTLQELLRPQLMIPREERAVLPHH